MTITLPGTRLLPPQFRIMRRKTWNSSWDVANVQKLHGSFYFEECWRSCIPEPGQFIFRYDVGLIDGQNYGIDSSGEEADYINLLGQIIRLQIAPGQELNDTSTPAWRTVFVGVCEHQEDSFAPGGTQLLGSRKFLCMDLLAAFTKRMPMDRHGVYTATSPVGQFVNCFGHPGYNSGWGWDGSVLGNKDTSGQTWFDAGSASSLPWYGNDNLTGTPATTFRNSLLFHTDAGLGQAWSDLEALQHALAATRVPFTPFFDIQGNTEQLSNAYNVWKINPGQTVWDFLTQVLRRQRGKGLAYLDWDDDSSNPNGDLTGIRIQINSQFEVGVSWTNPVDGSPHSIDGAVQDGTAIDVDLVGDHRNVSTNFRLGDRHQHVYDYLEMFGEPIEVLATLAYQSGNGPLAARWTAGDETAFASATYLQRRVERYVSTYQLFGIRGDWNGKADNGNGGTLYRIDYRCDDDGSILVPSGSADTSPIMTKVLSDIPLFEGWNYATSTIGRYSGNDVVQPQKRRPMVLVRVGNNFVPGDKYFGLGISVSESGITVARSSDTAAGIRILSGNPALGGFINWQSSGDLGLVLTVGLQLPHRIRMASGDSAKPERRLTIYRPGLQLWLASGSAIWDLDQSGITSGAFPAKRGAAGASADTYGILRDDRDRLAADMALAAEWYLSSRRTATWQLRDCGLLPTFSALLNDGITQYSVDYPKIGDFVQTLSAGGITYPINTPITKVHYTLRQNGVTTWQTDWSDLDLKG